MGERVAFFRFCLDIGGGCDIMYSFEIWMGSLKKGGENGYAEEF